MESADLVVINTCAVREHADGAREGREPPHDGTGVGRGDQHVDIADRLAHAPQRARVRAPADALHGRQVADERLGQVQRHAQLHAPARGRQLLDAARDVLLGLRAEALEGRDAIVVDGRGQVVDGGDPELFVERHGLLRPEAGHGHHLADARWDLGPQRLKLGYTASSGFVPVAA